MLTSHSLLRQWRVNMIQWIMSLLPQLPPHHIEDPYTYRVLESINILPYTAKGTLQMWLRVQILRWVYSLGFLCGFSEITGSLWEGGSRIRLKREENITLETRRREEGDFGDATLLLWRWRKRPADKECQQSLKVDKNNKMDSPLESSEIMQLQQHLNFRLVRFILDF